MPRILVYEFVTAILSDPPDRREPSSMEREGAAMLRAVGDDFRSIPGMEVVEYDRSWDRLRERSLFKALAASSDYTIVIAPEQDYLVRRIIWARNTPTRLIGPSPAAVRATADKLDLANWWQACGVPTPATTFPEPATVERPFRSSVVLKDRHGAGSNAVHLCDAADDYREVYERFYTALGDEPLVQEFVPGRPASVAFLIGEKQTIPLLPAFQHLSADGRFRYLGGELPIPTDLAERAIRLGRRAVECVPGLFGYVGVDLVLGDAADGSQDYAIEINPRLTTSYVGLRALADFNLAEAMLNLAMGQPPPEIRWKPGRVRFDPDGNVTYDPTPGAVWE